MNFTTKRAALALATGLGLTACDAPTLVSLQPIGAPQPTNAQQTFIDADRCSWWIVGNGSDLRWAPMTNSLGEHVCDGGATRLDRPSETETASSTDSFAQEMSAVLDGTDAGSTPVAITPQTAASVVAPVPSPVNDGKFHFVQVATFALESNAQASEALFSSLGYTIHSGAQERDNDRLFRLIIGPFNSKDEAQKAVERAFNEGFDDAFPFRK